MLFEQNFFVESNVTVLDPLTGKNREIDLIAEFDRDIIHILDDKVLALSRFVFEIKKHVSIRLIDKV